MQSSRQTDRSRAVVYSSQPLIRFWWACPWSHFYRLKNDLLVFSSFYFFNFFIFPNNHTYPFSPTWFTSCTSSWTGTTHKSIHYNTLFCFTINVMSFDKMEHKLSSILIHVLILVLFFSPFFSPNNLIYWNGYFLHNLPLIPLFLSTKHLILSIRTHQHIEIHRQHHSTPYTTH